MGILWAFIVACCLIMISAIVLIDRTNDPVAKLLISIACVFAMIGAVVGIFASFVTQAAAESKSEWFRSLRQPGTGVSCCDISDCKKTDATFRKGDWFASDGDGGELLVPPEKIIEDKLSIDGEAYLCLSPTKRIYCFIKPSPGA